jgi:hypothetical protein
VSERKNKHTVTDDEINSYHFLEESHFPGFYHFCECQSSPLTILFDTNPAVELLLHVRCTSTACRLTIDVYSEKMFRCSQSVSEEVESHEHGHLDGSSISAYQ